MLNAIPLSAKLQNERLLISNNQPTTSSHPSEKKRKKKETPSPQDYREPQSAQFKKSRARRKSDRPRTNEATNGARRAAMESLSSLSAVQFARVDARPAVSA